MGERAEKERDRMNQGTYSVLQIFVDALPVGNLKRCPIRGMLSHLIPTITKKKPIVRLEVLTYKARTE